MSQGELILLEPISAHSLFRHDVEVSVLHHHHKGSTDRLLLLIPLENNWQGGAKTKANNFTPFAITMVSDTTFADVEVIVGHYCELFSLFTQEIGKLFSNFGQLWQHLKWNDRTFSTLKVSLLFFITEHEIVTSLTIKHLLFPGIVELLIRDKALLLSHQLICKVLPTHLINTLFND